MQLKFIHNDMGEFMPNKAKVFFSCHPDDYKYFNEISKEVLDISYCFFYYALEDGTPLNKEEWEFSLKEMSLLVVPITRKYLTQPNRAFDVDLDIARKNHIPILPIMCEEGLVELFNEKFGEYQFLSKVSNDKTEVSYKDKLTDFLKSIIKSQEQTFLIMQNFKGLVFLSYRKKDREVAQKLMREIHNDKDLYDLCIWYDEFLTPGESFNDEISVILQACDLMLLNVTPSIVEDGNYIIQVEYPNAVALNKLVLPIEMVKTDKSKLDNNYSYLPKLVDVSDRQTILKQIKKALGKKFKQIGARDKTEHKYYVALGYLDGLGVAKDRELGVKLLKECAEEGYAPAVYELSTMYILGKCVEQDIDNGINLRNMLLDKAYKMAKSKKIKDKIVGTSQYLTEIASLAPIYYFVGKTELINDLNALANELIEEVDEYIKKKKVHHGLVALQNVNKAKYYISMGGRYFSRCEYQKALDCLLKAVEFNKFRLEEMWRQANGKAPIDYDKLNTITIFETYDNIGLCYLRLKDYNNAKHYLETSHQKFKEMLSDENFYDTADRDDFVIRYGFIVAYLGDLYTQTKEYDKAEKLFKDAIANQEMLVNTKGDTYEDSLISYICHLGKVYVDSERFVEAEKELARANAILERKLAVSDKSLFLVQIGKYNEFMGDLCSALNKNDDALKFYQKAVIQYVKLKNNDKLDEIDQKIRALKKEN